MENHQTVVVPVENVGQAYLEMLRARGIHPNSDKVLT